MLTVGVQVPARQLLIPGVIPRLTTQMHTGEALERALQPRMLGEILVLIILMHTGEVQALPPTLKMLGAM